MTISPPTLPSPSRLGAIRAGDYDTRSVSWANDLGPVGDSIASSANVSVVLRRADGQPVSKTNDLALGNLYLDGSGLVLTFWLIAPAAAAGTDYVLTITANTTAGRILNRDVQVLVYGMVG